MRKPNLEFLPCVRIGNDGDQPQFTIGLSIPAMRRDNVLMFKLPHPHFLVQNPLWQPLPP
jgi:hypothetical protein